MMESCIDTEDICTLLLRRKKKLTKPTTIESIFVKTFSKQIKELRRIYYKYHCCLFTPGYWHCEWFCFSSIIFLIFFNDYIFIFAVMRKWNKTQFSDLYWSKNFSDWNSNISNYSLHLNTLFSVNNSFKSISIQHILLWFEL